MITANCVWPESLLCTEFTYKPWKASLSMAYVMKNTSLPGCHYDWVQWRRTSGVIHDARFKRVEHVSTNISLPHTPRWRELTWICNQIRVNSMWRVRNKYCIGGLYYACTVQFEIMLNIFVKWSNLYKTTQLLTSSFLNCAMSLLHTITVGTCMCCTFGFHSHRLCCLYGIPN